MLTVLKTTIIILLLWAAPLCAGQVSSVVALFGKETAEHIETLLQSRATSPAALVGIARFLSHEDMFNLYQQREFLPIWLDGWQLKRKHRRFWKTSAMLVHTVFVVTIIC